MNNDHRVRTLQIWKHLIFCTFRAHKSYYYCDLVHCLRANDSVCIGGFLAEEIKRRKITCTIQAATRESINIRARFDLRETTWIIDHGILLSWSLLPILDYLRPLHYLDHRINKKFIFKWCMEKSLCSLLEADKLILLYLLSTGAAQST